MRERNLRVRLPGGANRLSLSKRGSRVLSPGDKMKGPPLCFLGLLVVSQAAPSALGIQRGAGPGLGSWPCALLAAMCYVCLYSGENKNTPTTHTPVCACAWRPARAAATWAPARLLVARAGAGPRCAAGTRLPSALEEPPAAQARPPLRSCFRE